MRQAVALLLSCDRITRALLAAAARCRVVIAVLGLIGVGLLGTPQAVDLLVTLGQDERGVGWFGFVAATTWLAANAWFWSRFELAGTALADAPELRDRLPRLLGAASLAIVAVALWHAAGAVPPGMVAAAGNLDSGAGRLRLAAAALAVGAACVALWRVPVALRAAPGQRLTGAARLMLGTSLAAAVGGMLAFGTDPVAAAAVAPAGSIALVAAAGLICGGTVLLHLGRRLRLPILLLVFAAAGLLAVLRDRDRIADNHDLRQATAALRDRPGVAAAFGAFLDTTAPGFAAPTPVVLVAASGGGIAAAYWTATILGDLADAAPRFAGQIFAISGVSGGALGALAYTAAMPPRASLPEPAAGCRDPATTRPRRGLRDCLQHALHDDFLGPALGAMLYPDLMQRFVPVRVFADRAAAMETAWEARWRAVFGDDRLARPFLDLWPPAQSWPALLLNGTSFATGGRLIVSNLALRAMDLPPGARTVAEPRADLLARLGADLPASTAAGSSARFPFISPLGVLRGPGTGGLAQDAVGDGGYFENFGATTLLDLLEVLDAAARRDGRPVRFVVVQIVSDPESRPDGFGATERMAGGEALLPRGVTGPATLLLRTRGARGLQATEALARRVLALGGRYVPVRLGLSPTGATAPLGWSLSDVAARSIDAQWTAGCRARLLDEAGFGETTPIAAMQPEMGLSAMWSGATCATAVPERAVGDR